MWKLTLACLLAATTQSAASWSSSASSSGSSMSSANSFSSSSSQSSSSNMAPANSLPSRQDDIWEPVRLSLQIYPSSRTQCRQQGDMFFVKLSGVCYVCACFSYHQLLYPKCVECNHCPGCEEFSATYTSTTGYGAA
ncbi:hypothetical protein JYU34_005467 [Plutella xylostella]|uniref:Uncharacterized protein n=1 Tax=Plutella xylostella TaxID=51655 RepID=A0ABQ7QWS2_PLUXY|nr:hypothetical protein JYU34_005467 [Plutella xylostella]